MGRVGQKVKKYAGIGLKGAMAIGALSVGQKAGDMGDNARMNNYNLREDERQGRARESYLAGTYQGAGEFIDPYIRSGKVNRFPAGGYDEDDV